MSAKLKQNFRAPLDVIGVLTVNILFICLVPMSIRLYYPCKHVQNAKTTLSSCFTGLHNLLFCYHINSCLVYIFFAGRYFHQILHTSWPLSRDDHNARVITLAIQSTSPYHIPNICIWRGIRFLPLCRVRMCKYKLFFQTFLKLEFWNLARNLGDNILIIFSAGKTFSFLAYLYSSVCLFFFCLSCILVYTVYLAKILSDFSIELHLVYIQCMYWRGF